MDSTLEEESTVVGNHRLVNFLRFFEMDRMREKKDVTSLYRAIFKDQSFEDGLKSINKTLEFSKLQIKFVRCEATCKEYYALVSTHYKHDVAWPSGMFTDNQLEYFQNILKQIMLSERGAVSSIDCLNLNKKFTKNEADKFIEILVEQKILVNLPGGKVTLSPMSLCELSPFIMQYFEAAVNSCNVCKKAVVYGVTCPDCHIRIHKFCFKKYKEQMKRVKCPNCNSPLVNNLDEED